MNIDDYKKDFNLFFNNLYTMDLLLNKDNDITIYNDAILNRICYRHFTVVFHEDTMKLQIDAFDNKKVIKLIHQFSYGIIIEGYSLLFYYFTIENISYDNIKQLKELILEIYKFL